MLRFDKLMGEGNKIIIIINESFVSISREHVLSKLKGFGKYRRLINRILGKVC